MLSFAPSNPRTEAVLSPFTEQVTSFEKSTETEGLLPLQSMAENISFYHQTGEADLMKLFSQTQLADKSDLQARHKCYVGFSQKALFGKVILSSFSPTNPSLISQCHM